ncbi:FeoB-associated Cys-rich membrane protein [Oscillospiraceae bacterium MB08-C2-2]|nr:FeoB-associated Cys-rich membrane protein [Oscillospiraceae bacterium MB08-C2-2]
MSPVDIIILVLVLALVAGGIVFQIRRRIRNKAMGGGCSSCGCSCSGGTSSCKK